MTGKIFSIDRCSRAPLRKNLPLDSASAGFTLIEVVLALTIFALLGTILYGAFALSHSALAKSQNGAARSQAQRSTADLLGSYIRSAYPYKNSPQEQTIYFEGESDSLTFVSAYSHGMGGRGMAKILITAGEDENEGGPLSVEEATPLRVGGDESAPGESLRVVLQERISKFRLAYLDPQADEESWQERWDGQERRILPRAVRFTFLDERGHEVRWIFPIMMVVLAP
jgi:prepilin-type N-terminal cleavage/methylation domain-containing protein